MRYKILLIFIFEISITISVQASIEGYNDTIKLKRTESNNFDVFIGKNFPYNIYCTVILDSNKLYYYESSGYRSKLRISTGDYSENIGRIHVESNSDYYLDAIDIRYNKGIPILTDFNDINEIIIDSTHNSLYLIKGSMINSEQHPKNIDTLINLFNNFSEDELIKLIGDISVQKHLIKDVKFGIVFDSYLDSINHKMDVFIIYGRIMFSFLNINESNIDDIESFEKLFRLLNDKSEVYMFKI